MTKQQAINKLKKTRSLDTTMLEPFNMSFDQFLQYAQLEYKRSKAESNNILDKFIEAMEKTI